MGQLINASQNMIRQWLWLRWLVAEKKHTQGQASKYILSFKGPGKMLSKSNWKKKTNYRLVSLNKRKGSDKYKKFQDLFCPTAVLAAAPVLVCIGCESRHNYCTNVRQSCCVMTSYILPLTPSPTPPRHINVVWRLKSCLELLHPLIGSIRGEHSSWRQERVSYFIVQGTDMYLLIAKWPPLILCSEHTGCWQIEIKNITEYYGREWIAPGFVFKRAWVRISTQRQFWLTLLLSLSATPRVFHSSIPD